MAWSVEFDSEAVRQLKGLDRTAEQRLRRFLADRVAALNNPRSLGAPLHGKELGHLWRYRVGDYRVICEIQDRRLVILVVSVGHRREVYR